MLNILTKDEIDFLKDLAALLQKYKALIMPDNHGVAIALYPADNDDFEDVENPILFSNCFDHEDIFKLIEDNKALVDAASKV